MITDWYNKMKSKLASALKNVSPITIKIEDDKSNITSSSTTLSDNESEVNNVNNSTKQESKPEPVEIKIHKPIYEYAHGKKFKSTPSWIVVHYTACINVGAKAMCKAMKGNDGASSHFYIDDKDIYQGVPLDYVAWHVGDGKCKQPAAYNKMSLEDLCKFVAKDWRYDLAAYNHLQWKENGEDFAGNVVSIGVDMCVWKHSKDSKKATDTDWYFKDEAVENLAKTVAYLANKYNISIDHIIRHADATGKLCPRPFVSILSDMNGDAKWEEFKDKVSDYMKNGVNVKFI